MARIITAAKKQKPVGTQLKELWSGTPNWLENIVNFVAPDPNELPMPGMAFKPGIVKKLATETTPEKFAKGINMILDKGIITKKGKLLRMNDFIGHPEFMQKASTKYKPGKQLQQLLQEEEAVRLNRLGKDLGVNFQSKLSDPQKRIVAETLKEIKKDYPFGGIIPETTPNIQGVSSSYPMSLPDFLRALETINK